MNIRIESGILLCLFVFKRCWWLGLLVLVSQPLLANNELQNPTTKKHQGYFKFAQSKVLGAELQLQAKDASLANILDEIARQTKVLIHYSVLPEGLVSATCVASDVQQLLQCLLDDSVNLVYRYPNPDDLAVVEQNHNQPVEVWLLGTATKTAQQITDKQNCVPKLTEGLAAELQRPGFRISADKADGLLASAQQGGSLQRATAIGKLGRLGQEKEGEIRDVLLEALNANEPAIRAQALVSWVQREGESARPELLQALNDSDAQVRLMALDSVDDPALLQQALQDSNERVRNQAQRKLDLWNRQNRGIRE